MNTPTCQTCGTPEPHPGALCHLIDGTLMCCDCWNAQVAERKAERRAELAARPRCEACRKAAGTWHVGHDRVLLCGRCKRRAETRNRVPFFAGPVIWTRDAILGLARP